MVMQTDGQGWKQLIESGGAFLLSSAIGLERSFVIKAQAFAPTQL